MEQEPDCDVSCIFSLVKDEELIEVTTRGSVTKPAGDVSTRQPTGSGEVDQEGQEEGSGFVGAYIYHLLLVQCTSFMVH